MITKKNLEEAQLAEAKIKAEYEKARLNLDAFEKYVNQINQGMWDPENNQIPSAGPFTVSQAALINVNLEEDYSYPLVFTHEAVWNLAGAQLLDLQARVKELAVELEAAKKTAKELEGEYIEEQERAAEIAANSPEVIAAKENNEAAKTRAEVEADKAEERKEMRKMLVLGLATVAGLALIIVVVAKAIK